MNCIEIRNKVRVQRMRSIWGFMLALVLVEGSRKKGVVHWADSYMCDDFKALNNMTWWFDFRMSLDYFHEKSICASTIDAYKPNYIPMVWGYYYSKTKIIIDDSAEFILGFNEPNHLNQSNMSPEKAVAGWRELEKNSKGKPLVSPSAAVCGKYCRSTEIEWFDEFFKLCTGCRIDYLATHTYWCNADKTMAYLEGLYKRYGLKIWLTEFACGNSPYPLEQLDFMSEILPRLEAADYIYRYAWYRARLTEPGFVTPAASLFQKDRSELTELGRFYNEFQWATTEVTTDTPITSTPPSSTTTTSNNNNNNCRIAEYSEEEILLILQSYKTNPTVVRKMLRYVKRRLAKLPDAIKAIYKTSSRNKLKIRIKTVFDAVICCQVDTIQRKEIRRLVKLIRKMPLETSEKSGLLYVPNCASK